ncbi:hypothetical protein PV350_10985 [Streptomyces sp. PA03-6a]|nr:hypothetical protein [Streptomyces sp. PA03-6a]
MNDDEPPVEPLDDDMRTCAFCGHPVPEESLDEYDCPVCGDPEGRDVLL